MANSAVFRPSDTPLPVSSLNTLNTDQLAESSSLEQVTSSTSDVQRREPRKALWVLLFAATIFLGAFLLFQVQPILGKFILPWFGGSPGVWTTCMLVFQCLLFGGYAYAHLLSSNLKLTHQVIVHVVLLAAALCMLPITPSGQWKPVGDESPIESIVLLLLCNVGVPYFLLSSTGPLLQSWLTQSKIIDKPYRLYSLSNVGSMLALLSFPFWFETSFSSTQQAGIWSVGFLAYAVLCIGGAVGIALLSRRQPSVQASSSDEIYMTPKQDAAPVISGVQRLQWLALAALPSMMLLATTNQVCLDTAVIPFLWIAPLAIYLLSFILTFDSERWYNRRVCVMLAVLSFLVVFLAKRVFNAPPLWLDIAFNFSGLFFTCMVCHGELYAARPAPKYLTSFYLSSSFGGALGGLFVGLVAPKIFNGFYEYQLGILCSVILFAGTYLRSNAVWRNEVPARIKWAAGLGAPLLMTLWFSSIGVTANSQHALRNFYGVLNVTTGKDLQREGLMRKLVHGRIVHGSQYLDGGRRDLPTTYYTDNSGVGQAIESMRSSPIRVGVVGLGAGTLATYGKEGDVYRFYEINPDVVRFADEYFSFLSDSKATTQIVLGDARLVLEREEPQKFDLFVLDAFSGDAIPVHLLTQEAMQIYRSHLKPDGKIAIHVSNLYFDLKSIVQGLADDQQMDCQFQIAEAMARPDGYASTWALLSTDSDWLAKFSESQDKQPLRKPVLWRDDRSNLFQALK